MARHLREHKVQKDDYRQPDPRARASRRMRLALAIAQRYRRPLRDADIIISSTASPLPLSIQSMVERALKSRRNQPMLLVDIAVPRDVVSRKSANWRTLIFIASMIYRHHFANLAQRRAAAVEAETIVERKPASLWLATRPGASETVGNTVVSRSRFVTN